MTRHAKASSVGSTQGQGSRQGSFVRGAGATRGYSSAFDGSGAPSRRRFSAVFSLAAALLALALFASSAFASKQVISDFGTQAGSGGFGGELHNPRDVAVNESGVGPANAGDAYVADEANNRIERFDSDGNFVSAWGKDTIASSINERQRIVIEATAGTFTLSFNGSTTEPITYRTANSSTVESELAALPSVGSGNVEVSGEGARTNPFVVTFTGALGGSNQPTITVDASELSGGTASVTTLADGTSSTSDTGSGFEACTVATECQAATASGENGALDHPQSVALDQDTGNLYVSDRENRRIDEYDGEGSFIRSFGWDVVESGPDETGSEYEVCEEAEGDVCKAGEGGSGVGQYGAAFTWVPNGFGIGVSPADANASTGTVYLADTANQRIDTYNLDGTSPSSFGSSANFGEEQPRSVAVDSRGIVYASDSNNGGDVQRYDSENADGNGVGFLAPIVAPGNERQEISFSGFNSGDDFKLTCPNGTQTEELTYLAGENGTTIIKNGLEAACGAGNLSFSGEPPNLTVTFEGALAASNQPQMTCATLSGSGSCSVTTTSEGHSGPLLTGDASIATAGLAVNPAGSTLYVLRNPFPDATVVQQFGPTNEPGLSAPPSAADDTHGAAAGLSGFSSIRGFGFDGTSGRLYVSVNNDPDGGGPLSSAHRVYVLDDSSSLPDPTAEMPSSSPITEVSDRSATFNGEVDPKGGLLSCKFQYSTDGVNWADAGYAEGTGNVTTGSNKVTNVKTTSGAFAVGQLIDGEGLGSSGQVTIVAVGAGTLTLSSPASRNGSAVALSARPVFPPACASLSLNGGPQGVHQSVVGLIPDTHYFVRLQVIRPYFSGFTPITSNQAAFTTASGPPAVAEAMVKTLDEHSVRISATIDPGNSPTTYVVQYGTTPALGSSTAPVSVGAGTQPVEVSPVIGGLSPATTYYFKVVATNLVGSTPSEGLSTATFPSQPSFGSCPNDLLRTGPSAHLPDCRAYEQVTPTDKAGSDAYGSPFTVEASNSGDGITFYTYGGFPNSEGFQLSNVFLSHFGDDRWSTAGLNTPPSYGDNAEVKAWTSDLRLSFAEAFFTGNGGAASFVLRDSVDGSRTVFVPEAAHTNGFYFRFGGAFDGDSKIVFYADGEVPVTSGPAPLSVGEGEGNVYVYDRESGDLTLAGVLPDSACGSPPCAPPSGAEFPAAFTQQIRDGNVVSSNGDVYFTDRETGQLYVRRDAAGPDATTEQVSASERTDCADHDPCSGTPEPDPAGTLEPNFLGATPDGSHAFFKSGEKLTDDSAATSGAEDLYRFEPEAPAGRRLTDLAPGAGVQGVLGSSDDGDYVYFAANADLDGGGPAAPGNCAVGFQVSGSCSVYLWQAEGAGSCATAGGCIAFVARIDAGPPRPDALDWGLSTGPSLQMKSARVSADGRVLVFRTKRQITGYDNRSSAPQCEGSCPEFYRYEAEGGQIACLTCDPTGAPPTGEPQLKNPDMFHVPNSGHGAYEAEPFLSRNLSPDGKRFFFQTPDRLVPADVNGEQACPFGTNAATGTGENTYPCTDVYEWEAPGEGTCTEGATAYSPANGGCIYLLSTGTGPNPSYLADVSESGDTAFIFSRQQLVPADEDTQEDIYAVKVDGGLAYQHAARPAPCEGDACRGASSKPSEAPGAGSGVFQGPGNPKSGTNATRCPKGKRTVHAKGKVRCVAKHKKHHHKRAANNNRRASR